MNTTLFKTEDTKLQKLFDKAEELAIGNLRNFAGRKVLVEGAGYEKIWLETQPMGGEMYAKRSLTAALNNQLLFMENARSDGRLPGSIALIDGVPVPQFNKLQGFCFPAPALNMYYLMGEDKNYLNLLASTLEKFDAWLWSYRDTDNDGCLESFCKYDTGEDEALRYGDAPNSWEEELPPTDSNVVPMASSDLMSWSFSARATLCEISKINNCHESYVKWTAKAYDVRKKLESYLWDKSRGALFDRNKDHKMQEVLTHNTLKAMYWKSISCEKARTFVAKHLLNPEEFFTEMPLPSVAANDPLFRNIPTNNWSGQCEALTYQRAIRALENYGYDWLIPILGQKLFDSIYPEMNFVQQYDPFTGVPSVNDVSGGTPTYGPAILSVLEYISRMYGVHREKQEIYWGCFGDSCSEYTQVYNDIEYRLLHENGKNTGFVDGKERFSIDASEKIITDLFGNVKNRIPFTKENPNERY